MSFYGLLSIAPLALLEFGAVAWYLLYWDRFPKNSIRRLLPWLIFILSLVGIPILQIKIYQRVTSLDIVGDGVFILISLESVLAIALIFYLLVRRRTEGRSSE